MINTPAMIDDPVRQPDGPLEYQATAKRQKVGSDSQLFSDQAQPTPTDVYQMQDLMSRSHFYQVQDSISRSFQPQLHSNAGHMGLQNQNRTQEYLVDLFPPNLQGAAFLPQPQPQPHLQHSMIPTTQPPYAPSPRYHPPLPHPPDRSLSASNFGQDLNYNYAPRPVQYHQLPRCHCGHQCPPVPIPVLQLDQQGYYGPPPHSQQRHQPIFYPQPTASGVRLNPQNRCDILARPESQPPPPAPVTRQNTPNDMPKLPPPPILHQAFRDLPDFHDEGNVQIQTDAKVQIRTDVESQDLIQLEDKVGAEKEKSTGGGGRKLRSKRSSKEKDQAMEPGTSVSNFVAAAMTVRELQRGKRPTKPADASYFDTAPPGGVSAQPNEAKRNKGKKRTVSEGTNERRSTGLSKLDKPDLDATPSVSASVRGSIVGTPNQQEVNHEKSPKRAAEFSV